MIALYGVLIGFGQFGLLFLAMDQDITPGLASLVVQSQAFMTVILATLFFKENLSKIQIAALLVSLSGLLLIAINSHLSSQGTEVSGQNITTLLGLVLVLLAALSWSVANLVVKKAGEVHIISFLAWSSMFAVPPLFAVSYFLETLPVIRFGLYISSNHTWAVVLRQSVGNTLVGYGLWNYLLRLYPAAIVSPWALLVPVFGLSASAIVFEEPMQDWKIIATLLILSGLAINSYEEAKTRRGQQK
jgi:O-acetylserine/cysteine efflux transporter